MKKADLLKQLQEALRKGELKDEGIISKVELADEKFIDLYLAKVETLRKSAEKAPEVAPDKVVK